MENHLDDLAIHSVSLERRKGEKQVYIMLKVRFQLM
jgi:hypothetical protein